MINADNKSPLEHYTDLIQHLYGKKIFPSSLKEKYTNREKQPLKALQDLVDSLIKASLSPRADESQSIIETNTFQSSQQKFNEEKSNQMIIDQQTMAQESVIPTIEVESLTNVSQIKEQLPTKTSRDILSKPVVTQGYKLSAFMKPEETTTVSKTLELKIRQFSSLDETNFLNDDVSSLPELKSPADVDNEDSDLDDSLDGKTPGSLQNENILKIDSEKLFDSALSDLSGLFDKKKKEQ